MPTTRSSYLGKTWNSNSSVRRFSMLSCSVFSSTRLSKLFAYCSMRRNKSSIKFSQKPLQLYEKWRWTEFGFWFYVCEFCNFLVFFFIPGNFFNQPIQWTWEIERLVHLHYVCFSKRFWLNGICCLSLKIILIECYFIIWRTVLRMVMKAGRSSGLSCQHLSINSRTSGGHSRWPTNGRNGVVSCASTRSRMAKWTQGEKKHILFDDEL